MRYHFSSSETLSKEFLQDIKISQTVSLECFKQLVQASFRLLSGEIDLQSMESLYEALEPLEAKSGQSAKILAGTVRSLTYMFQGTVGKNVKIEQLVEDLQQLGFTNETLEDGDMRCKYIAAVWKKYFVAVSRGVLEQTLQVNPLKDMDWRFGVTASSSEMERVGKTFLQLKFTIEGNDGKMQNVFLELTLPQFYDFLHQMEKAKATLDFFS